MNKKSRMYETEYYKFENMNTHNHVNVGDCVIRAISNALEQKWETTFKDLCEIALKLGRMPNDRVVFDRYLVKKGWHKCSEPRNWDNSKMTVRAFMRYTINDVIIANVGSLHVTCIKNKKVHDTWDCSNKTMHTYYVKG